MSGTLYFYISGNLGEPAGTLRNFIPLPRPLPNVSQISHVPPEGHLKVPQPRPSFRSHYYLPSQCA